LIVSPPRAGKTILLQQLAKAVIKNHPDAYVIMLLIDERPEEVTEMERHVKGSTAGQSAARSTSPPAGTFSVSEMVIEKAKRMVEFGHDVVIFLDSITRLARAWNTEVPHSGKILSGRASRPTPCNIPNASSGAARNVEEGSSLTIVATALVDTAASWTKSSPREFKGTGNTELHLDRRMVEKRVWPAIDVNKSGTRREELLMDEEELRPRVDPSPGAQRYDPSKPWNCSSNR